MVVPTFAPRAVNRHRRLALYRLNAKAGCVVIEEITLSRAYVSDLNDEIKRLRQRVAELEAELVAKADKVSKQ